jgi:hypothetical protein
VSDVHQRAARDIDRLVDEASRLGAAEDALQQLGEALRRDPLEGARVAARFFGETTFVPADNHDLRKFFMQSIVEKAFYQSTGDLMSSVAVFPELYYGDQGAPSAKPLKSTKASKKARAAKVARALAEAQADIADQETRAKAAPPAG